MSISNQHWEELHTFLLGIGCDSPPTDSPKFREESLRFLTLLLEKNENVNLTGAKDLETAFWKHLADSLSLLSMEPLGPVVDWGSGGGFPGIPLALARHFSGKRERVFFLDSVGKKVRAIEEFCAALDLKNTACFTGRGEVLIPTPAFAEIRTVVMRAVAPPERAIQWLNPRIQNWIFFLGPSQSEGWQVELAKFQKKKKLIIEEKRFSLPRENGDRILLRASFRST